MALKRFVAGVVCPKCGASDVVRVWQDPEQPLQHRECVDCGYQDSLSHDLRVNAAQELGTRVSLQAKPVAAEPIKMITPDDLVTTKLGGTP